MFPQIHASQQEYDSTYGSQQSQQQWESLPQIYNANVFTMNPSQFHNYYTQPFAAPVDRYQEDLDWYYINNKDKCFAKWNQHSTGQEPPISSLSMKMSMPQLPRLKLPAVDWTNFVKDAEVAIKRKNKFLKGLDNKSAIMTNLLEQSDEWLLGRYYEQKNRFKQANLRKKDYKVNKALDDYKKFQKRYYGIELQQE